MARNYSKACSLLPTRPHQNNKVIVDGRLGCIPFSTPVGYSWCDECRAKNYCSKEVKWIITKEKMEARWPK